MAIKVECDDCGTAFPLADVPRNVMKKADEGFKCKACQRKEREKIGDVYLVMSGESKPGLSPFPANPTVTPEAVTLNTD